jgi:hypothetical protein
MKDTFTLADLANFKLPEASAPPVAPAEQPTESSPAQAAPSDEIVETSAETTPAPAAEAETAPEAEPSEAPKEKYIPKGRFDEVIEERNALRRFNEYLLAKEQSPIVPTVAASAEAPADAKPTLENCNFDVAKYEQSMTAWTQKQVETARTQGAQQASAATAQAAFNERMASYAKANPSLVTVLGNPNLPQLAKDAAAVVVESDIGPQILHYLGANPDQAARIARKTPAQQAADVGRIEGELRAKSKTPQKIPQITRAPSPPTPTQGRGSTPTVDPMKMSTKEWIEWDRRQTLEKRRAAKATRSA